MTVVSALAQLRGPVLWLGKSAFVLTYTTTHYSTIVLGLQHALYLYLLSHLSAKDKCTAIIPQQFVALLP